MMEFESIPGTPLKVSRIAIGTWAIGGLMLGGTGEAKSISAIHGAFDHGINVVDTAPVYGFGRSEEIVGKAIAEGGLRSQAIIATKVGLEWQGGRIWRNSSRAWMRDRGFFAKTQDRILSAPSYQPIVIPGTSRGHNATMLSEQPMTQSNAWRMVGWRTVY